MTDQVSLWQDETHTADFAELCCALYEREIAALCRNKSVSAPALQGRLKSLPYYIKRTAECMIQSESPLTLDIQNASWSAKQASHMPLNGQDIEAVTQWYTSNQLSHGSVVPIVDQTHIVLDSIDRVDYEQNRFRTNLYGWFDLASLHSKSVTLLKPNKKVMTAACTGHAWLNDQKANPVIPTLRELLLSCAINWRNFKQPLIIKP